MYSGKIAVPPGGGGIVSIKSVTHWISSSKGVTTFNEHITALAKVTLSFLNILSNLKSPELAFFATSNFRLNGCFKV
jgi:hypothetical protein